MIFDVADELSRYTVLFFAVSGFVFWMAFVIDKCESWAKSRKTSRKESDIDDEDTP